MIGLACDNVLQDECAIKGGGDAIIKREGIVSKRATEVAGL
jgi:ribose 5-phosphate isomerase